MKELLFTTGLSYILMPPKHKTFIIFKTWLLDTVAEVS